MFNEDDLGDSLKQRALDAFTDGLNDMGIPATGEEQRTFFIDVVAVGDEGTVVLSVLEAMNLPGAIVDWGAEEQVFYKAFDSSGEPRTNAGDEVREHLTREWMEQFVSIHGQYMLVFKEMEMQREIKAFLREIVITE